jgi:hypothetical protein
MHALAPKELGLSRKPQILDGARIHPDETAAGAA